MNVYRWLHEIDQNCDIVNRVLVGNKCDDPERKVVLTEDAKRFAEQVCFFKMVLFRCDEIKHSDWMFKVT